MTSCRKTRPKLSQFASLKSETSSWSVAVCLQLVTCFLLSAIYFELIKTSGILGPLADPVVAPAMLRPRATICSRILRCFSSRFLRSKWKEQAENKCDQNKYHKSPCFDLDFFVFLWRPICSASWFRPQDNERIFSCCHWDLHILVFTNIHINYEECQ